ncbi:MAG: nucleotidyltransferase domain-containing protein [Bacteroidetes bacterium]|nr:nucleotidyltransferase domain-containing protein [Bacteroidota bacterium]
MQVGEKELQYIINRIAEAYQPMQIWLFGSYARNTQNQASDIDLLVIKETETKATRRPDEIHKLFNPYIFDLDILVYTPSEFEKQKQQINTMAFIINKEGKRVYERNIS